MGHQIPTIMESAVRRAPVPFVPFAKAFPHINQTAKVSKAPVNSTAGATAPTTSAASQQSNDLPAYLQPE